MIASIRGQIQELYPEAVVIDVSGVGMHVFVPEPVLDGLKVGEMLFLHTYLVVREDSLTLYGFKTKEEREFFNLLIGVNGVGPRSALKALSVLTPDAMRRAVFHEQADVFTRVPGVGMKTAQKILLQLQDRIPVEPGMEPVSVLSDIDREVINALTGLGYSIVEAQAAIQSIPRDTPQEIETRLRLALQYFA